MTVSSDQPISTPAEDRFELDAFARTIATNISDLKAPSGAVLAVNGPWGSGKSSAINLIRYHLQGAMKTEGLSEVTFNPWWFAGTEALTRAFFQELSAAIGPSLPDKARKSLASIGRGVSTLGPLAGAIADVIAPGVGRLVTGAATLADPLSDDSKTIDEQHKLVSVALANQKKRFLITIDDIDRLSPDDALAMFRLVKSVGRLPNVIYLLAFDRLIAERIVAGQFPSEGSAYLEKIIQASFELPPPLVDVLRQQVIEGAVEIMGEPKKAQETRFWNIFHDVVAPTIRTPRDVVRLMGHLSSNWVSVAGNVDRADFLALTALQIAEPDIYRAIKENPAELCGASERENNGEDDAAKYDALFKLGERLQKDKKRLTAALRRLFPRLGSVWGRMFHSESDNWSRDRLVASRKHFRSYFAYAVAEDALPADRIDQLIAAAGDQNLVRQDFDDALGQRRRNGSTMVPLLLEELTIYASDVSDCDIATLTSTLFEIADRIDPLEDEAKGYGSLGGNHLRLRWLLNTLVFDRMDLRERETVLKGAMEGAALCWACNFTEQCLRDHVPSDSDEADRSSHIVSEGTAERFRALSLEKLQRAADNGSLLSHRKLDRLLLAWVRLNRGSNDEARRWADQALEKADFVVAMATQMPSESWSIGMTLDDMGDRVSSRSEYVKLGVFDSVVDIERLEERAAELADDDKTSDSDRERLRHFLSLPRVAKDQDP